jgi:hypothetical protein
MRRLELLERPAQADVGCGLAVMHEVAGDEDQRRVVVVRVDVGDRRLKARIRIKTVERRAGDVRWKAAAISDCYPKRVKLSRSASRKPTAR